jgi:hypothetical protein
MPNLQWPNSASCRPAWALTFVTLQVYKEMETEGATSEAVVRILRHALQPVRNSFYMGRLARVKASNVTEKDA